MAATGAVACSGCLAGVAATFGYQKVCTKPKQNGANYASPGLMGGNPWASPGGWRTFQSPNKKTGGAADLGKSFLTEGEADFSKLGSLRKELDTDAFIATLGKLIGVSKYLQNNPRLKIVPQERLAADIVMEELRPYCVENGGPLQWEMLEYVPGRPSLKVVYPGTGKQTVSFVGSHFDVVPADPEQWNKDPFKLTIEGDKLFGRGTTDCLGHVALITQLLAELGKSRPALKRTVIVVFIAAEEGGETGVGVDMVVKHGKMEASKQGPVYWIDSADSQPCCGTCGTMSWSLTAKGRIFHSGFPHKGINSIELVSDAIAIIQERFYDNFPPTPEEDRYGFACGSNMKPTQVECKKGSVNQICPEATMHGDIRVSPFYDVADIKAAIEEYVADINANIDIGMMPSRGPYSTYQLASDVEIQPGELRNGVVELKWTGDIDTFRGYEGIACSLDSQGHKALVQAIRETAGVAKPFSVNGSLPLVKSMQKAGFDLQLCGFGLMAVYHGIDEYCTITSMKGAYQVLLRVMALLESASE